MHDVGVASVPPVASRSLPRAFLAELPIPARVASADLPDCRASKGVMSGKFKSCRVPYMLRRHTQYLTMLWREPGKIDDKGNRATCGRSGVQIQEEASHE